MRDTDGEAGHVSSTALCNHLYMEAVGKGIPINGKICNAVMVGFGADLTVGEKISLLFPRSRDVHSCVLSSHF